MAIKKALIYDPYLDTLGGGERYSLTFAKVLSENGYEVEIAWPYQSTIVEASKRFSLDLSSIKVSEDNYHLISAGSLFQKYKLFKNYDLIFWVSDGSLPFLFGKKNFVHFQVPFAKVKKNFLKTFLISKFVYNSNFTKSVIEKSLPKNKGLVLYPPVDIDQFGSGKKENLIIGVGRFDAPLNNKRQDVLIDAFKILHQQDPDYRLVLLGGLLGEEDSIDHLRVQAQGLPIDFIINPDFETLKSYYSRARFFWHAAGYQIDEDKEPEKVEHFGITTVEAIASGCLPVVIGKGGQLEIIKNEKYICQSPEEMSQKTIELIKTPESIDFEIKKYSLQAFYGMVKDIVS